MIEGFTKFFGALAGVVGPLAAVFLLLPWLLAAYALWELARERKLIRQDRAQTMGLLTPISVSLATMATNQAALVENVRAIPQLATEVARLNGRMDGRG